MVRGAVPDTLCVKEEELVSALDTETTVQPDEYVCPRCDGVVARDDTVCPACGQNLEAIAAADEKPRPMPEPLPYPLSDREIHVGPDGSRWTEENRGGGMVRRAYLPGPTGSGSEMAASRPRTTASETARTPTPALPSAAAQPPRQEQRPGATWAIWSLLMALIWLVDIWISVTRLMPSAVATLMDLGLILLPILGVVFGRRAVRLGERGLGKTGVVANAVALAVAALIFILVLLLIATGF